MPPRKKNPVTFDEWLGKTIDDETNTRGGRVAVARWIGASPQSVNRRAQGKVPYLAREVEIIAGRIGIPTAELISRALRGYGGIEKLLTVYGVSEAEPTVEDNVTYIGHVHPEREAADDNPRKE
ncbi:MULTISPECIES: hypothetical protein [unclassified Microbacterium]|uniref:hypothetical protein n=1 Tax=unclassified Microbacterium TaxID=2609290 RepID=UPI0030183BFD